MSSQLSPTFALPSAGRPRRTLVRAGAAASTLLLLLLAGGGWRYAINQSKAQTLRENTIASLRRSVIAIHPEPGKASRKLVLPASLKGYAETQVFARTNGYLKAWHKTIGDKVKKGDLLAEIDVPELEHELAQGRAALAQVKARRELAYSTWERWDRLSLTDGAPRQEVDEKHAAFLQAEADLAAAAANVKRLENIENYRRVIAPFDGVITRRGVDVGSLIGTGTQELFALTQTDPLRLNVWVPQAYADQIKGGQTVSVRPLDGQEKPLKAHIDHVAGALDPLTRSRLAEISLPNPDGKLLPGAYLEIAIDVAVNASPLVVPANVLVMDQEGAHVVIVDSEGKIGLRPVKIGRDFGREVEILEGIALNEVLVASPSDLLTPGEKVSVVEAEAKPNEKLASRS
ncbi:efflux RND transporter periplasmic adaptor subunit [Candidatus Methylomicrobium oryzae]|uniref:efflux RND transporter periplasmic adaptor subunit n=1 Tax=Candidatus Methylomicrobium oryzae TaxID=2802053 RepID=UPI0019209AA5|nr:efflux RND transporter periplasmic adaptor subunit [Methylomicrobium sp. RS1]MBL1266018.1 efflux RND transporter periplasmic adaptor subunit [Methylomicrobium sp. RS1]